MVFNIMFSLAIILMTLYVTDGKSQSSDVHTREITTVGTTNGKTSEFFILTVNIFFTCSLDIFDSCIAIVDFYIIGCSGGFMKQNILASDNKE